MTQIKERNGIAVYEIGGRFYVVGIDRQRGQVTSVLRSDMPSGGGQWFGRISEKGVQYVGHGATRSTAMRNFKRLADEREAA